MGWFGSEPEVPDTIGGKAGDAKFQKDAPKQRFTKEDVRRAKAAEQRDRRKLS